MLVSCVHPVAILRAVFCTICLVFLACRPCGPAGWLALLLTIVGDVDTNPGTDLTTLISSTSPVLDKTPEPRVPLIHALTATTPPPDPTPAFPSPSHPPTLTAHTHATQTTVHASLSPQQPHSQQGTTTTSQTDQGLPQDY